MRRKRKGIIDASRDRYGPDRDLLFGPRLVRRNNRLKFNGLWFCSESLTPFVGRHVYVDGSDLLISGYSSRRILVYEDYYQRDLICSIPHPDPYWWDKTPE